MKNCHAIYASQFCVSVLVRSHCNEISAWIPNKKHLELNINTKTLLKLYVNFQFLKELINAACEKTVEQPTMQTIRDKILLSQEPAVCFRSLKHGKRSDKHISEAEYTTATQSLQQDGFGRVLEFSVARACTKCKVFIKSKPNPWPPTTAVKDTDFDNAFSEAVHSGISAPMRAYLQSDNYLPSQVS